MVACKDYIGGFLTAIFLLFGTGVLLSGLAIGDPNDSDTGMKIFADINMTGRGLKEASDYNGTSVYVTQLNGTKLNSSEARIEVLYVGDCYGCGTGGGETNTGSNVGVGGVGVYDGKVGVDLQFKNVNAENNKISITDDAGNNEIDIGVNEANFGTVPTATSCDQWDALGDPSAINCADITDDNTYLQVLGDTWGGTQDANNNNLTNVADIEMDGHIFFDQGDYICMNPGCSAYVYDNGTALILGR